MKQQGVCYIYIIECKDGRYYTGYSNDVIRRFKEHSTGKGAKFTLRNKPKRLIQCWKVFGTVGIALKIEYYIKRLQRIKKQEIIEKPAKLKKNFNKAGKDYKISISPAVVKKVNLLIKKDEIKIHKVN